jgi:hypothetical protein
MGVSNMRFSLSTLIATGAALCALGSAPVKAAQLNFDFSVTNTIGDVSGTFSGEIFGLTNNATSSATSVLVTSFPAGLDSLLPAPVNATSWDQQVQNSFTVTNGQITGGGFWAQQTINGFPQGYQLYLNGDGGPFNFLNLDGTDTHYVWGNDGLAAANFTPAVVPEFSSLLGLSGFIATGGLALIRRRRAIA